MTDKLMVSSFGAAKKIRVGVIGTGAFAQACHIPGLQSHPQAEIVAICGRQRDRTQALADNFTIPHVYLDYEELCARPDLDAVTIATPNSEHARQACAALSAGKHVFCEKPLAMTVAEARRMVCLAAESHKVHQVAFTYRYLYSVQELRRRVRRGDIGEPHYLRAQFDRWEGLQPAASLGFRDKVSLAGGGVLYDVGSHLFDLTCFILGPIEAVTGFAHRIPRQGFDSYVGKLADIETDHFAAAWFIHRNGVRGQWFASNATPPGADRSYLEVVGQEGALHASLSRGSVDVLTVSTPADPSWKELPLPEAAGDKSPHCLGTMMQNFVNACIRGKLDDEVDASFYDGMAAQQGLSAVTKATIDPKWIYLKEVE